MNLLSSLSDIFVIILGFGFLIFVHELGHFMAAKWAGIRTEAFAIGMGHVVASWRKGIGFALGSTERQVVARAGKPAGELSDTELEQHGIGETEYSLRWLPIGGFVKMLGQEDLNPSAVSGDPRAYGRCPIGKRMIVVSAGVIMNLITAGVMFMVAFLVGVKFEDAVIGEILPGGPAARAVALNADVLGIDEPGLRPGDRPLVIDDDEVERFADLYIGIAMAKPDVPIDLTVRREGVSEPLRFSIIPEKAGGTGLLSIGITPASSTTLRAAEDGDGLVEFFDRTGLTGLGLRPGMTLESVDGEAVTTLGQMQPAVDGSNGTPGADAMRGGTTVDIDVPVSPIYQRLIYAESTGEDLPDFEQGLLGMCPLIVIEKVVESHNEDVLRAGDVVLRVGSIDGPRMTEFLAEIGHSKRKSLDLVVLRDGEAVPVQAKVNSKGKIGVQPGYAWDHPILARPMASVRPTEAVEDRGRTAATPVAPLELFGGTRIASIGGDAVADWPAIRAALRTHTTAALTAGEGADVEFEFVNPTPGRERETLVMELTAADVADLHALGWTCSLFPELFEPVRVTRTAGGNPLTAIAMGADETWKMVILTYLTIDRLVRGSVGVDQLRGPLGIVDLGTKVMDSGAMYLIFFLAMISVNLAVINFLPIPIVDGGLFLFLIYEKLKGRPPSIAFQNAATIVGLFMIGTVLLVVTWHDVMRLIG